MNLIEWAQQYLDVAADGFKAELIWLQVMTGERGDLTGMTFELAEWQAFAHHFMPEHYPLPPPSAPMDTRSAYDRAQAWACFAMVTGASIDLEVSPAMTVSDAVHAVIWSTRFGTSPLSAPLPDQIHAGLSSPDDNQHAMCALAARLLGHPAELRQSITSTPLSVSSYHAKLVAMVAEQFT